MGQGHHWVLRSRIKVKTEYQDHWWGSKLSINWGSRSRSQERKHTHIRDWKAVLFTTCFLSQDAMHTAEHNVLSSLELRPWLTVQYSNRPTALYTYCVNVNISQSLLTWWLKQQNYFEVDESVKRQGTKKQRNISCCEFDLYAQRIMLTCRTITDEA